LLISYFRPGWSPSAVPSPPKVQITRSLKIFFAWSSFTLLVFFFFPFFPTASSFADRSWEVGIVRLPFLNLVLYIPRVRTGSWGPPGNVFWSQCFSQSPKVLPAFVLGTEVSNVLFFFPTSYLIRFFRVIAPMARLVSPWPTKRLFRLLLFPLWVALLDSRVSGLAVPGWKVGPFPSPVQRAHRGSVPPFEALPASTFAQWSL